MKVVNLATFTFCLDLLIVRALALFFGFILLSDEILFLFGSQIASAELISAYPGNHVKSVVKLLLVGSILDFGMPFENMKAVVTVHNDTVPCNNRIDNNAVCHDILIKLPELLGSQGRYLAIKLPVDLKLHLSSSLSFM